VNVRDASHISQLYRAKNKVLRFINPEPRYLRLKLAEIPQVTREKVFSFSVVELYLFLIPSSYLSLIEARVDMFKGLQ